MALSGIVFSCFMLGAGTPPSCLPNSQGGTGCNENAPFIVELDQPIKNYIVYTHNILRSFIAFGLNNMLSTAVRMPTVQWDDELAVQAVHNARSCFVRKDECRNTANLSSVGQNFGSLMYNQEDLQLVIDLITAAWGDQSIYATQNEVDSYPSTFTGPSTHNFLQMVNDRVTKIGCALQKYNENGATMYDMLCNYSVSNIVGQPVYVGGAKASGCTTGQNPNFAALCSIAEVI